MYMYVLKFFLNTCEHLTLWGIRYNFLGRKWAFELSLIKYSDDGLSLSRFSLSHQFIYSQSPFQWWLFESVVPLDKLKLDLFAVCYVNYLGFHLYETSFVTYKLCYHVPMKWNEMANQWTLLLYFNERNYLGYVVF